MKKIIKPFDFEAAKNGAKIETRNGKEVEILRWDLNNKCSILGIVTGDDGYESFVGWGNDGTSPFKMDIDNDLVIVEYKDEESEDEKMLNSIQGCLNFFFDKCDYDGRYISKEDIFGWIEKKKNELERIESWWVARDKNGEIYMFNNNPKRVDDEGIFLNNSYDGLCTELDSSLFSEITWENSPKKIEMKLTPIKK